MNKQVRGSLLEEPLPSLYRPEPGFGGLGGLVVAAAFYNAGCANEGKGYSNSIPTRRSSLIGVAAAADFGSVQSNCLVLDGWVCIV